MRAWFVSSRKSLCLIFVLLAGATAGAQSQDSPQISTEPKPLITEVLDESHLTPLKGNTHRLARPEFDLGTADGTLPTKRMLLVLKRSDAQEAALRKLLDDQQDKNSSNYHKWLTPEKFGQQFGPTDTDMQTITSWLQSHGFEVGSTKGRTVLEFSGTAAQVREAFHTTIHSYLVNGETHWANSTDPQIPAALAPAVAGIFTLHSFYKKPQVHLTARQFTARALPQLHPLFTSSNGHALAPADYYTIYNFNPLGSGLSQIAIVGRSNINVQDVTYFHYWMYDQALSPNVVVNGPDPGDLGGGEEAEAVLDTTWAGAVAPSNSVTLVVSQSTATTDGVDLSEAYIVDNNITDVMSESFGNCEANYTSAEATGVESLAQQAAAQGITYVVAAGDSGSAGCDDPNSEKIAIRGLSVNLLASTPYNVAVGGTVFNENGQNATYWKTTNDTATQESAISYIPEDVWNDSCQACAAPNIWAGGGGKSVFFSKPSWQTGVTGIPSDGARDIPDVSLTAAAHDPYLICLRGSCVPNTQGYISFYGIGGTSASAPAFAGIMSLVASKTLTRLGQPNYVLYRLAAAENLAQCNASSSTLPASSCVFNDVTVGNNAVPGETNYGTGNATYQSGKGYDLATGLGSVNVTNLINQWNTVSFSPTTTAFSISPATAVHGDPLNVTGTVTPNSGTGIPTGMIWLTQTGYSHGNLVGDNAVDFFSLNAQGAYSGITHLLPGGTYQVNAHYAGDGTYAASDSSPGVQVTIQPENTTTTFSILTTNANGNLVPFASGPYGTPVYYQAHVAWQSGYGTPTAYVNFWDTNGFGSSAFLDSKGTALSPVLNQIAAGTHSITAGYYGDNSFNSSADLTPINFTITQLPTSTALAAQRTAQSLMLTATVSASGVGSPATGVVTFSSGATVLGTNLLTPGTTSNGTTQATATLDGTGLAPGQYTLTASYPGDGNYISSTSTPVTLNLTADFTVANQGITSQTVTAGSTASYINDIVITPFFGFSSTVNVSCAVPARGASCSVTPASYPLTNGTGIGTLSVTTQAHAAAVQKSTIDPSPSGWSGFYLSSIAALLLCAMTFCWASPRRVRLLGASALLLALSGCGGSSSGSSQSASTGTPAGTYTVTVTAAAGTLTHTTTLTLVVQ